MTGALLAVLALTIDWGAVDDRLRGGSPLWLAAAVSTFFLGLIVGAWRWHVLLVTAELPALPWQTLRAYFMGAFANNFLPTGFGGDAVRALALSRSGAELARGGTTVVVDRLTALACLLIVALAALAIAPNDVPRELAVALIVVIVATGASVVAARYVTRSAIVRRLVPHAVRPTLTEIRGALDLLLSDHRVTLRVTVMGVVYQALAALSVWCGARAIGLELAFALIAVTLPLVLLATLVPISLAGFGIREGGYAVLLGTAAVTAADATLLSLVTVVTMALASLPGALAIVAGGARAQPAITDR